MVSRFTVHLLELKFASNGLEIELSSNTAGEEAARVPNISSI